MGEGIKRRRLLSFGTGTLAGYRAAVRPIGVSVHGGSRRAPLLCAAVVVITVVAVVLHAQKSVTVVLEQSGAVQLQLLQLPPQLVPLLLLLLLPVQVRVHT